MRLALLSDLHLLGDDHGAVGKRLGGLADLLLMRAVQHLNRLVRPDAVVLLGDLINFGEAADAPELLQRLQAILGRLDCPWYALPGNHDGDTARFAAIFGDLPEWMDIGGVRLVPFVDPEQPGYNASRLPRDLDRLRRAAAGAPGPLITLQHVPIFPPGRHSCPYNYVNADEVLATMHDTGVRLALAGHYHEGFGPLEDRGMLFAACPALCESPFRYQVIEVSGDQVSLRLESLRIDPALGLVDTHVHTPFAYCSENMDIGRVMTLAPVFGLAGFRFTEHSGHLYYPRNEYARSWEWGIGRAQAQHCRLDAYLDALRDADCPQDSVGIELDCCDDGTPLVRSADLGRVAFRIGAMHSLPCLRAKNPDVALQRSEFLGLLERFLQHDIQVLAHPFRVFRRSGVAIPPDLFAPTVRLLRRSGVAAELNFHTNEPPLEFVSMCLEEEVPLTLGSDAHNLYEIGDFALHLDLLRRAGWQGDPQAVLLPLD